MANIHNPWRNNMLYRQPFNLPRLIGLLSSLIGLFLILMMPTSAYAAPQTPTVSAVTGTADYGNTAGGKAVTITGTKFVSGMSVTIGGAAATNVTFVSSTSLTATTPAHAAGTASVLVTSTNGTNAANSLFTYYAAPTVSAVTGTTDYRSIAGGKAITITGTNFISGNLSVTFDGAAATNVTYVSATSLTATTPAGTAGTASVLVTSTGGTNAVNTLFTYYAAPTVSAVTGTADYGNTAGGKTVTITGTNFVSGALSVSIRGTAATNVTFVSSTSLTATTPARSDGTASVLVTSAGGTNAANSLFTYYDAPTVSAVTGTADYRSIAGGKTVTITGKNFISGNLSVTFDGAAATNVAFVSSTSLTATTPVGVAGTASVLVTSTGGTNAANSLFTYYAAPTVSAVTGTADYRSIAGGKTITITGTNFISGSLSVTFDGAAATNVNYVSATSLTATTPAGTAGTASVLVTSTGGTNAANTLFTYYAAPTVSAVTGTADYGNIAGAKTVTITGTNFVSGATSVTIGGTAATNVAFVSSTSLTATTPAHAAGTASVVVTSAGGTNAANSLFTYYNAPTVSAVTGTADYRSTAGGKTVTITGTNFVSGAISSVTFGGIAATNVTYVSATSLTATTPAHAAGSVSVLVSSAGGTNSANSLFTYDATPTLSAISPVYGVTAGSTAVTLTGSGFTGATAVSLGGTAATNVTVVSDTSLTATTPAHAAGAASVLVTTPGGINAANSLFSYTNCGPGLPLTTGTAGVGALWQMLALPCVPTTGTIASVLGDGSLSNLTTANYASATPGIGWIIEDRTVGAVPAYRPFLTSDILLNVGTGYWLKSYQAPTNGLLTMDGTTTPTDVTPAQGCYSANGCKAITVTTIKSSNRYNLVGNPFAYPIDWSKVRVRVDGSALTLTPFAANSAGYISNNVNIWNGTTYDSFNDVSPTLGNLQYFKSFLVNVLPGAFGHTIELLIPAEQSTLSQNQALPANPEQLATLEMPWYMGWLDFMVSPAAATPVPAVSDHVNPQPLAKPTDWYIRLKVNNPVTGWEDRGALLGQLSDAKTGFDGHDIPKMAPFSTPYLTLVFPHPDWGKTNAADYASDFHPVDLSAHSWSFEVRANPVGSKVFLSWEGSPALLKRSQLLEVATGKIILPTDPLWTMKGYPITLNTAVQRYVWQVSAP